MNGVFVLNCDCGSGKMKRAGEKMVGNEGEASKLTAVSDQLLRYGSHKK